MVDDGSWDVVATITGELGAEAQVSILAVGEEVLVEEPDLIEHAPAIERRRRTRPEDVARPIEPATVALAVPEAVRQAAKAHGVPCPVEHPAVVEVDQLAREEAGLGMIFSGAHQRFQPAWILLGVVVEEYHVLCRRRPDPGVERGGDAPVLAERDHIYLREVSLYEGYRAVEGAVIHHDGLEGSERLISQRAKAQPQEPLAVPVRDDDRDAGRHGFRLASPAGPPDRGSRLSPAVAPGP